MPWRGRLILVFLPPENSKHVHFPKTFDNFFTNPKNQEYYNKYVLMR